MRTVLFLTAVTLTLAGCNKPGEGGNSSSTTTTTTTTQSVSTTGFGIKPGKWENRSEILEFHMEGVPAAALAAMKQEPFVTTSCISAEDAANGPDLKKAMGDRCSFTKYDVAGGRIATEVTCKMPTGQLVAHGEGSYSAEAYSSEGEGSMEMAGGRTMSLKSRNSGKWLGECDGTEANAKK